MNDIMESTPEQHAYHLGWSATDKDTNPYDAKNEQVLYENWERGLAVGLLADD